MASYYKRVSALFYDNRLNVFAGLIVFEIAADIIVLNNDNWIGNVFIKNSF